MRVERRTAPAEPSRHRLRGVWAGLLGAVLGVGLGLLAARLLWSGGVPGQTVLLGGSLSQRLAALRVRGDLPSMTLNLDFAAYQALVGPDFDAAKAVEEPVCVQAEATYGDTVTRVELCPSRAAGVFGDAAHPVFELASASAAGPLTGASRSLLSPAGPDAAAVRGYLQDLAGLGLPAPAYEVVRLTVNGSDWGAYAMEERWPMVVAPEEDAALGQPAIAFELPPAGVPLDAGSGSGFARAEIAVGYMTGFDSVQDPTASEDALDLLPLALQAVLRFQELLQGRHTAAEVLDAEAMGQVMALTALWRGCFVPDWRAIAFVYEGASSRFVPVASGLPQEAGMALPSQLYDDPEIQRAYAAALRAFSDPAYLEGALGDAVLEELSLALGGEFASSGGLRETLAQNQLRMRRAIAPPQTLRAWHCEDAGALCLELEVTEPFPIEVLGLALGEENFLPLERAWAAGPEGERLLVGDSGVVLRGRVSGVPEIAVIRIPRVALPSSKSNDGADLSVATRIWGLDEHVRVPVAPRSPYDLVEGR